MNWNIIGLESFKNWRGFQEDSSVGKVLCVHAGEPELNAQNSCVNTGMVTYTCNPSTRKVE